MKFEVAEFMNFKWLFLGIYLKLGDKWDYIRIHILMDFQNIQVSIHFEKVDENPNVRLPAHCGGVIALLLCNRDFFEMYVFMQLHQG